MSLQAVETRKPQILVVDDEVAMVRSLELLLRPVGDVKKAYSVPEAEEELAKPAKIDCVITDVCMPEESGLNLLDRMRNKFPETPVIVMTAFSSVPQAVEALHRGAFEYVVKPFENQELVEVVKRAIIKKGVSHGETRTHPTGWICLSQSMKEFLAKVEKLAPLETPVLFYGEIGVGKGRAARWLHDSGSRSKKEFLSIDGRAHEDDSPLLTKGLPKNGTIFIAEVLSLTPRLQDRLAEILKEGKVRVLASTSASPEIQAHPNFRQDVFQELTKISLRVPSLRDRAEDLEALTTEILRNLKAKYGLPKLELLREAFEALQKLPLASNVRALEQVLERAAFECRGGIITPTDLRQEEIDLKKQLPFAIPLEGGWRRIEMLKESLEKELIERALEKYPNLSNTQIAEVLGTTRRILELRMKDYHIREGC